MQMQETKQVLQVFRYNNKNYVTGWALTALGWNEFFLGDDKNKLYEVPQYKIDDEVNFGIGFEVVYNGLPSEQVAQIYKTAMTETLPINNSKRGR